MKPQNKKELVDGRKAFWAERVTEKKCAKHINHSDSGGKRSSKAILKIDFTTQNKTAPLGATNFTKVIDQ